jgi:hypothetical protein
MHLASSLCRKGARGALHLERAAREVEDQLRRRGVEADDVEHPRIRGISDRELVRNHPANDQPGADPRRLPVVLQRLRLVDPAGPGLAVGEDREGVELQLPRPSRGPAA